MRVATVLPQNPCVSHIRKTGLAAIMHCTLFALVPGQELQINCNKPLSSAKPTFFCNRPQARPGCKSFAPNVCQEKISLFFRFAKKARAVPSATRKKTFFYSKVGTLFFSKKTKKKLVSALECAIFEAWKTTTTTQTRSTESPSSSFAT